MRIAPRIQSKVADFIDSFTNFSVYSSQYNGPVHVLFPQVLRTKLDALHKISNRNTISFFVAHKPTHSVSFLKEVLAAGHGIDVSSLGELQRALSVGFQPQNIECTGPKNKVFIRESVRLGCLLSVDSIGELEYIGSLNDRARVLIRVSNPLVANRELLGRRTKFGIDRVNLPLIYGIIKSHQTISFEGFHFHQDGHDAILKAGIIEYFLNEIMRAKTHGLNPHIINMGGGFHSPLFADKTDWQKYISFLSAKVSEGQNDQSWSYTNLGLRLSNNKTILNRSQAETPMHSIPLVDTLAAILSAETTAGIQLEELLFECNVKLYFEPGFSLYYDCGITFFKVQDVKAIGEQQALICNANMFTLSSRMFAPLCDPIHLTQNTDVQKKAKGDSSQYFILGNLCREDDCIVDRLVYFDAEVNIGDILLFCNTGAYSNCYESTVSQLHPRAVTMIATSIDTSWNLYEEKNDI